MTSLAYIDIHTHILTGADDGARDPEESMKMLRMEAEQGCTAVILTPHFYPGKTRLSLSALNEMVKKLSDQAGKELPGLHLYPGGELFYRRGIEDELQAGRLPTLAGSDCVLIEFQPDERYSYIRDGLSGLLTAGFRPVVAHVERYEALWRDRDRFRELRSMGCFLQMNADSLMHGSFLTRHRNYGLLKEKLIHMIATDAHRAEGARSPAMEACIKMLERKAGPVYTEQLVRTNAELILKQREI